MESKGVDYPQSQHTYAGIIFACDIKIFRKKTAEKIKNCPPH